MYSDRYMILHPHTAFRIGIEYDEKLILQFGIQQLEVSIRLDSELNPATMILSKETVKRLSIPTFLEYEVILNENILLIGPYIGVLYSNLGENLAEYREKSPYFIEQYNDIKGAVISFAFESINPNEKTVKGYLYRPNEQRWIPGTFPYPASIFRLAVLSQRALSFLQNEFGNHFFNSHRFSKWELYHWLIRDTELSSKLPPTILYTNPDDIINFLKKYSYLYLKPLYGSKGRGIIKIIRSKNLISLQYQQDNSNVLIEFSTTDEALEYFDNFLISGTYIIQKMLDITFENNQVVDFRLILMKDQCGEWRDLGLYGRIGRTKNIVSNRSSGGKVETDMFVLEHIYHFSQEEALLYRKQLSDIAIKAAKALDQIGLNMGRYGVDLAIDRDKKIWLIEMNHRNPNDRIASFAGDKNLIHDIRFHNLLYAKNLAGFSKQTPHVNVHLLCDDNSS